MHWLYRPKIMTRSPISSNRLIPECSIEWFAGALKDRRAGAASFGCCERRKFLRVQMHTKRQQREDAASYD